MRFSSFAAAVTLGLAAASTAASAQDSLVRAEPEAVAAQLQQAGLKTEESQDGAGDPMIVSFAAQSNFEVYFYGCNGAENCLSVQFNSCFDAPNGTAPDVVNTWNFDMRYAKASLDQSSDPCLKMDIDLTQGVHPDTFQSSLTTWVDLLGRFRTALSG